uniref:Uncharacterized protein n=1 Tax=Oryza sativa subsp. indica TaxID=39946 RepID=A0A8F2VWX3_ORYSI|nr:hypothetical protein Xa7_IRBB7.12 [Oryza sativa Indica Group]
MARFVWPMGKTAAPAVEGDDGDVWAAASGQRWKGTTAASRGGGGRGRRRRAPRGEERGGEEEERGSEARGRRRSGATQRGARRRGGPRRSGGGNDDTWESASDLRICRCGDGLNAAEAGCAAEMAQAE